MGARTSTFESARSDVRMGAREQVDKQRAFYDTRAHQHLQARDGDYYAWKLAARLARSGSMGQRDRVLEVGAGFGRFTFPLLEHCGSLCALDLSQRALDELAKQRDDRGIDETRCSTLCLDVSREPHDEWVGSFDLVVGFFLLHHLPDPGASVGLLSRFLRPGGRMVFLEPNRRNPLFWIQVAACPDMTWAEEKGMFQLSARQVLKSYRAAGLERVSVERFGFFPPQVLSRIPASRGVEARLEASRILEPILPFLLLSGHAGGTAA